MDEGKHKMSKCLLHCLIANYFHFSRFLEFVKALHFFQCQEKPIVISKSFNFTREADKASKGSMTFGTAGCIFYIALYIYFFKFSDYLALHQATCIIAVTIQINIQRMCPEIILIC